jgi:protocatechuate 3,4-dioxygenase beta subunit
VALKAKAAADRRRREETRAQAMSQREVEAGELWSDLQEVLDEELHRLPETYRTAVVFCYLEGKTHQEAAQLLGWPVGTVKGRLARARALLRTRLTRRGVTLPAALLGSLLVEKATAAVPLLLIEATVQSTLLAPKAAGLAATPAAALAEGVLQTMLLTKLKLTAAFVLALVLTALGMGTLTHRALAQRQAEPSTLAEKLPVDKKDPKTTRQSTTPAPAVAQARSGDEDADQVTITGRVLDAKGLPLAGAEVGVVAQTPHPYQDKQLHYCHLDEHLLARTQADDQGRYRAKFSRAALQEYSYQSPWMTVVASAPGHAVGWAGVKVQGNQEKADLTLEREEPVRGRLFDLQGQPAAGVSVHVVKIARDAGGKTTGLQLVEKIDRLPFWPPPATSDAQGRFVLRGVNRQMALTTRLHSDRFAMHDLSFDRDSPAETTLSLAPPRIIEGRVVKEDTRQPVGGIKVNVVGYPNHGCHNQFLSVKTDRDGRFRVNHYAAPRFDLRTDDLRGEPYFAINLFFLDWPRGAHLKQTVELVLPRGVLQSGKVIDEKGEPVAGAGLLYLPHLYNNPRIKDPDKVWMGQIGRASTARDGTFQIAVLPGPGHIVVHGPWRQGWVGYGMDHDRLFGASAGALWAGNDFIPLDVKEDARQDEVLSKIQRARTLKGQVIDPHGRPVADAKAMALPFIDVKHRRNSVEARPVKDGRFEIAGCDPNQTYRVVILDGKNHCGALASVSAKKGPGEPKVPLQPCGSVVVRLVDPEGKPLVKQPLLLWMNEVLQYDQTDGERGRTHPPNDKDSLDTDTAGRCRIDDLVAGVQYSLQLRGGKVLKHFTVRSGQRLDLGDIVATPPAAKK